MNKTVLFALLSASVVILFQGCQKTEVKQKQTETEPAKTSGLKLTATGQYGTYKIVGAEGQVAEIADYSMANGGTWRNVAYTGTGHQKWRITYKGNGYFTFMNHASGKLTQAYNYQGTYVPIQNSANNADNQLWRIWPLGNNTYKVINKATGLALTSFAATPARLQAYTGKPSQIWGFSVLPTEGYRDDEAVRFFQRTTGSISFDQASSIELGSGKVLWIGEDTYTDNNGGWNPTTKDFPCYGGKQIQFFDVRNSALIQPANHSWNPAQTVNMTTTHSTYKYEILASPDPKNHGGTYSWPGVGVSIGNHVYMYSHEGGGSFNKTVMYDFTEGAGTNWGLPVRHEIKGLSTQTTIGYAIGWTKANDGYVYTFGGLTDPFGGSWMHVARFAQNNPFVWQFWDSSKWVDDAVPSSAAQIPLNGGTTKALKSNSSVTYINGKFVLIEMDFGYACPRTTDAHNIYISTSTSPTGPFSARKVVYQIADRINGALSNHYVINAHPAFNDGRNELLVTYCLNYTGCSNISPCTNNRTDPYYYQAKAVRIPYEIAGL